VGYQCFIEGLWLEGLCRPSTRSLPSHWDGMKVVRQFRHATFNVSIQRADVRNTGLA
jgi:cellobionic acid phosphorylase